jgi:hypothetical protein
MAIIDTGYLTTIAEENQRLVETAKGLWALASQISAVEPKAASQLQQQVDRLLDISERISSSLARAQ